MDSRTTKTAEAAGDGGARDAAGEVRRMISAAKCKQAVELAKEHHKKSNTPDSQQLLVEAYAARIAQFVGKGMAGEAQTLIDLVRQRFPDAIGQLGAIEYPALAAAGKIDDLLRPLGSDQTPAETKAAIESVVARMVTDLPAAAESPALPDGHPLRLAAAAVWKAFTAVTTGPVTDEQISLPEVSRKSPFAAWKMLVRAVALFYRMDDDGCRRALDAIPADSSVTPAAAAVRAMVGGKKPAGGFAAVLYSRVLVDDKPLRNTLQELEPLFGRYDLRQLINGVSEAMHACRTARPELLEPLRQRIYAVAYWQRVPMQSLRPVLGMTLKDAGFWRLIARAGGNAPDTETAIFWERFLRHGVAENLFAEDGPEAAAVWTRIGEIISSVSQNDLNYDRSDLAASDIYKEFYIDQPAEIARQRPAKAAACVRHILEPGTGFERAAKILRASPAYSRWWIWAVQSRKPDKVLEDIADQWHRDVPTEVIPLLVMSKLAEDRNALSLALKRLGQAEAIDPMNKEVRAARVRLTMAVAWKHFADRKPNLVEKDLTELAALPAMADGDRTAVLDSMRGAWHAMKGESAEVAVLLQKVTDRMGPVTAPVLFKSIHHIAKVAGLFSPPTPEVPDGPELEIALGMARLVRLSRELKLSLLIPNKWDPALEKVVRQDPCPLSLPDLALIGEGAASRENWPLVYIVTAAGLARADTPAFTARFLLMRASSLKRHWHGGRRTQCLRAALDLARQTQDEQLTAKVFAAVDDDPDTRDLIDRAGAGRGLDPDVLARVLENERKAVAYPDTDPKARKFEVPEASTGEPGLYGLDEDDFSFGPDHRRGAAFDDERPPELVDKAAEVLDRKGVDSLGDVFNDPEKLADLFFEMTGKRVDPAEAAETLREAMDEMGDPFGGGPGGRPGKKKKRKR